MFLKQYYLGCLAHASYLLGDEESRTAAVVDPQRDIDQYLGSRAEAGGYRSAIAASLLELHQFEDVTDLVGGIGAWEAAQLKVAS